MGTHLICESKIRLASTPLYFLTSDFQYINPDEENKAPVTLEVGVSGLY